MVQEIKEIETKFLQAIEAIKPKRSTLYYVQMVGAIFTMAIIVLGFFFKMGQSAVKLDSLVVKVAQMETTQKQIVKTLHDVATKDDVAELLSKEEYYKDLEKRENIWQEYLEQMSERDAVLITKDGRRLNKYRIKLFKY